MKTAFGYVLISSDGATATTADVSADNPITLLDGSGAPLSLPGFAGKIVRITGRPAFIPGQFSAFSLQVREVFPIAEEVPASQAHLQLALRGNIGDAPDNFEGKSKRFSASLAVNGPSGDSTTTTWVRLTIPEERGLTAHFSSLEKGQPLLAIGDLSAYVWKNEKRAELSLLEFALFDRTTPSTAATPAYVDTSIGPEKYAAVQGF